MERLELETGSSAYCIIDIEVANSLATLDK